MFHHALEPRGELRLLDVGDTDEVFATVDQNRVHLRRFLPWVDGVRSPADSLRFIEDSLSLRSTNGSFQAGIWQDGELAGCAGFHLVDWNNRKTSLGYWLAERFVGQGLVTRACRVLLAHAFEVWALHRIVIQCATINPRSQAVAERLGLRREGIAREAEWLYDHYVDLIVYSMLEDEWKALAPLAGRARGHGVNRGPGRPVGR
jgi:ribosomal-protein-serine acetyltransferase